MCGWLADRYGRKPMVMAFGLGVALAVFPVSHLVTGPAVDLFVAQLIGLLVWALLAAIFPAVVAEQVPTRRARHGRGFISRCRSPSSAARRRTSTPGWARRDWAGYTAYVGALGLMAFAGGFLIKETAGVDLNAIRLPGEPTRESVAKRAAFN